MSKLHSSNHLAFLPTIPQLFLSSFWTTWRATLILQWHGCMQSTV